MTNFYTDYTNYHKYPKDINYIESMDIPSKIFLFNLFRSY